MNRRDALKLTASAALLPLLPDILTLASDEHDAAEREGVLRMLENLDPSKVRKITIKPDNLLEQFGEPPDGLMAEVVFKAGNQWDYQGTSFIEPLMERLGISTTAIKGQLPKIINGETKKLVLNRFSDGPGYWWFAEQSIKV